jgi:hypothetical protein
MRATVRRYAGDRAALCGRPCGAWLGGQRQTCQTGHVTTPDAPEPGRTLVEERVEERTDWRVEEGDHERFSHYADASKITEAMVLGTPVRALCGKVWVPSRDPQRFPICPECKEIYEDDKRLNAWE